MPLHRLAPLTLCAALALTPAALAGQSEPLALSTTTSETDGGSGVAVASTALERGRYAVVINLDENRLYFRKGDLVLWSAPVGTGTGLRLEKEDRAWDFSTPNGVFHVQFKEENPVWIAPDWYYIENGLPVPPADDKRRYFPGGLGAAAVYLGHDLAIHGTDKPELLGQRVSHGCIRLSNRDALRLYHNVQIGTEVVIVGGERVAEEVEAEATQQQIGAQTFTPARPKKEPRDPVLEGWKAMSTEDLLAVLENELWLGDEVTRWPEVAGILLRRGLNDGDDRALEGLLAGVGDLPNAQVEREYATFLAHAYARGPVRVVELLSAMEHGARERAASALVGAVMELYNGDFSDPAAPWPTRRVPRTALAEEAEAGWSALARAEGRYR